MTITTNASNDTITFAAAGGGSASTGDLTFNGSTIISPSNGDITLDPSGTGKVTVVGAGTESATLIVDNGSNPALITSNSGQYLHLTAGGEVDGATGGMITIQNGENQNILINPHGTGSVILGSATGNGSVSLEVGAVKIDDNAIFAARSNDDLYIHTSGSGNVNLENLKLGTGGSVVTTILDEDAMGTNSATALATQQSIKAYVDANGNTTLSGSTNNTITTVSGANAIQGEANITFDGTVLAVTGNITSSTFITATGALNAGTSITAGTTIGNDAITIDDHTISTTRSNDTLYIEANGTGRVNVSGNGVKLEDSSYSDIFGNEGRIKGTALVREDLAVNPHTLSDRMYGHAIFQGTKITASSSNNNNFRPRNLLCGSSVNLNGFSYTRDSRFRGPLGAQIIGQVNNPTSTNSTINTVRGAETSANVQDYSSSSGDITVIHAIGSFASNYFESNGAGDINVTNSYSYYSNPEYVDSSNDGETTVTNHYGFYNGANGGSGTVTNAYAFFDSANALSQFGSMKLNTGATVTGILDEDGMGTNSATQLATQQSIKAYVDANAGGGASRVIIGDGFTSNVVALTDGTNVLEGAWVEKTDADGVASVSGNTFTLAAGTYFLDFKAPQLFGTATGANEQAVPIFYLNNDTDSSIVAGSPDNIKFSGPTAGAIRLVGKVDFAGYFTINAQKTFSIKYVQANATNAKFALGEGSWGQKTQFWIRIEKF